MQVIYSRVSTDSQTTDNQTFDLTHRYPQATVVTETASGAKNRPALNQLVTALAPGDTLIVAALDRLGRKTTDVLNLIEELTQRGVNLISVREGVDYSTPTGRLVTQILVSVAEMERALISERTKTALANAKAKGVKLGGQRDGAGRKRKTYDPALVSKVTHLLDKGVAHKMAAEMLGLSVSTVQRIKRRHSTPSPLSEHPSGQGVAG